jgi:hypothetical protein
MMRNPARPLVLPNPPEKAPKLPLSAELPLEGALHEEKGERQGGRKSRRRKRRRRQRRKRRKRREILAEGAGPAANKLAPAA